MTFFTADDLCKIDKPLPLERIFLNQLLQLRILPILRSKQPEVPVVRFQTFTFRLDMAPDRWPPQFD